MMDCFFRCVFCYLSLSLPLCLFCEKREKTTAGDWRSGDSVRLLWTWTNLQAGRWIHYHTVTYWMFWSSCTATIQIRLLCVVVDPLLVFPFLSVVQHDCSVTLAGDWKAKSCLYWFSHCAVVARGWKACWHSSVFIKRRRLFLPKGELKSKVNVLG